MKNSKIAIVLILSLLFTSKLFSQSTIDLDEKKGFKDFILGDDYSKWSNDLKFDENVGEKKYYAYTGTCCQQVFQYDLENIILGFKDNKLVIIYLITTKNKSTNTNEFPFLEYVSIKSSFTSLFGKPYEYANDNSGNIISTWNGENVFLTLEEIYLGIKGESDNIYASYKCTILIGLRPNIKSGF